LSTFESKIIINRTAGDISEGKSTNVAFFESAHNESSNIKGVGSQPTNASEISRTWFFTLGEADSAVLWAFEVFVPLQRPSALHQTNICHVLSIFISQTYP
jgi:hypothetical protein